MRRLPGILLATGAILIVVVALLISGLRLSLPKIDHYRVQLLERVQHVIQIPVDADFVKGRWETFGPTLEAHNVRLTLPDNTMQIERVTLALDVWQSLVHWRWKFRDLTFHQLQFKLNVPFTVHNGNKITLDKISDLFLYRLDRFELRDSRIAFLTPSGQHAEFHIPQLTWLNSDQRHRAEGEVSLSTLNGQHGVVQLRLDLRDERGLLNTGAVYMQADDIDMKPWFSRWLKTTTGLESADFSLAAWLHFNRGEIDSGNLLLKKGNASWLVDKTPHRLDVDNLLLALNRQANGWQVNIPALNLKTDQQIWPPGALTALWLPETTQSAGASQNAELRIRAIGIQLERLYALLPTFSFVSPETLERWQDLQPQGKLRALALDIPLQQPNKTRFQALWQDLEWQHWQRLPGVNHFSGALSGSVEHGRLTLELNQSTLPHGNMFRSPLEIEHAQGALTWQHSDEGWQLASEDLEVKAKSLWLKGDFRYQQKASGKPWLEILAGIRLYDAAQMWRYFPEPLMGKNLVDYLSGAILGGQVDNASLLYVGNPQRFPYKKNEGQFQVHVPLRHATFQFQPHWPALNDLAIDLNFANDGLWMDAPQVQLGNAMANNLSANIPNYMNKRLFIDADIAGDAQDVHAYLQKTPLNKSVGAALDQLQVTSGVSGRLHLDIPLNGERVQAKGSVTLNNNALLIKPLGTQLKQVSGKFSFQNGRLTGDNLVANWLGQPLKINFNTREEPQNYKVNVALKGDWPLARIQGFPPTFAKMLNGNAAWQSKIAINLPNKGPLGYAIDINADLKKVSARLPPPLNKSAGEALPINVKVNGGLHGFTLNGSAGKQNRFNSQWLLAKQQVTLDRGVWSTHSSALPALPKEKSLVLTLPVVDAEQWLRILMNMQGSRTAEIGNIRFPTNIILNTPQWILGGQVWRDLQLEAKQQLTGTVVTVKGKEITGSLLMQNNDGWRADFSYLYYNPQLSDSKNSASGNSPLSTLSNTSFQGWPSLRLRCESCWFMGQNWGALEGEFKNEGDTLRLARGVLDTGYGSMHVTGFWKKNSQEERSALQGKLSGSNIEQTAKFIGASIPLKVAPYQIDFDLRWRGQPWQPQINTLNGHLDIDLGKGEMANMKAGRAGQLLRLVSFDALLRKLQFDFNDTFGKGFYFDSIRGSIKVKDGIMRTDNLLIDGLSADIAMNGQIDLIQRKLAMQAVVAPELSATVGVATAFVINPIVGAAVFAASQVLSPLWSKISFIRYDISGSFDQPRISEVLRKSKEKKKP